MYRAKLGEELVKMGLKFPQITKVMEIVDMTRAETYEEGAITLYACVLNSLIEDFWPKTAARQIEKLNPLVWGMYGAFKAGVVTTEDCASYIKRASGIELTGKTIKLREDGKWERVEGARKQVQNINNLLTRAADELEKTGGDKALTEQIRDYLKET